MRVCLIASAALLLSCEPEPLTEIMVVVESDMTVPSELDGFVVEVRDGSDAIVHSQSFDLAQQVSLPADFGVLPRGNDASRRITVDVAALLGAKELFSTRAITTFVEGEKVYLQMFLAERCVGVDCEPNQTCRREGCVPIVESVLVSELPRYAPSAFGSAGRERVDEIVVGETGVHVAGLYGGAFTFDGATFPAPGGGTGAFLMSRTRAGKHRFTRTLPSTDLSYLNRVVETPGGRLEATGYFSETLTESSSGQSLSAGGSQASFYVRYSESGVLERLELIGRGGSNVQSFGLARTSDGRRVIGGLHSETARFGVGGGVPDQGLASAGADDGFVAMLGEDLQGEWATSLGGAEADRVTSVVTAESAIYAGGNFTSAAQMGPDALSGALENGFVARLTPSGAVEWARSLSGSAIDNVRDVTVLADGAVVACGVTASADFAVGSQALPGTDGDGFVAVFEPDGDVRWAARLAGTGSAEAWSVALGELQKEPVIAVAGSFSGQLVLGTQALTAAGTDLFVALLALDGTPRFAQAVGGDGDEGRAEIGAGKGQILLGGEFREIVGLGSASFAAAGDSDVLLVQIAP